MTSSRGGCFIFSKFPVKMVGRISSPNVRSHKVGRRDELARALVVFLFSCCLIRGRNPYDLLSFFLVALVFRLSLLIWARMYEGSHGFLLNVHDNEKVAIIYVECR